MSLRHAAANLLRRFRFPPTNAYSASVGNSNALPILLSGMLPIFSRYNFIFFAYFIYPISLLL